MDSDDERVIASSAEAVNERLRQELVSLAAEDLRVREELLREGLLSQG